MTPRDELLAEGEKAVNLPTITVLERDNDDLMGDLMSFDQGTYGLIRQADGATLATDEGRFCLTHRNWVLPVEDMDCRQSARLRSASMARMPSICEIVGALLVRGAVEGQGT